MRILTGNLQRIAGDGLLVASLLMDSVLRTLLCTVVVYLNIRITHEGLTEAKLCEEMDLECV